ncbi:PREDICTED: ubiquitin carboxyl-terminal hydrolase 21-like [Tarenaya hassleriana]|uniref:ubiquitin carboxyl-terminal hydrolase 21-like n=1 Tax=Tarenaya hassleriana TaxID=28532 RepID=UPI00053C651C|nr:PREDICTED: ubiquitin carboxyl-terminal hydrolase 21-like [Tarenaya hassleriana]XP_010559302.1 PREDICTED: ubiquitin carboxyl-terminal hydrolase 21-like [Tarenaya hassleriana]
MSGIVNFAGPPFPMSRESFCSPQLAHSVETLDEPSTTAPIRALVAQSLALLSSDLDDQPSAPTESLDKLRNLDGSCSYSWQETLVDPIMPPCYVGFQNREGLRSHLTPETRILPASDCGVNTFIQIQNSLNARGEKDDASGDLYTSYRTGNHRPGGSVVLTELGSNSLRSTLSVPQQELWKIVPTGVGAGLLNLGNTCFMNAVLQCFTHTVPLIESLYSWKYSRPCTCANEFCLMQVLQDHIEIALRSSGDQISPVRFFDNLNQISSAFQRYYQEDAHEFLQSFLDKLERCCLDPLNRFRYVSSQGVNIVQDVFGGRLVSRLRCCNCNSFSDTFETSLCLSLGIDDVDDLPSALESFTRVEKLENLLTCDSCKKKVSKEKQLALSKLPLVATFHLKRFKNDGFSTEKILKHVNIPLELDLWPYMSGSEENEVSTTYHLYALVEHLGSSLTDGHYVSYVRSAHETWHKFDDSRVTRIEEGCVLSQDAYILFYARERTLWFSSVFERIKPLCGANIPSSSRKSVLDPACREFVSDHSDEDIDKSRVEETFRSMENPASCCPEPQEDVFHSAESNSIVSPFTDAFEPPEAEDYDRLCIESHLQDLSNSYLSGDRAAINNACVPVPEARSQACSKIHQEGKLQIQLRKKTVPEAVERDIAFRSIESRPSQRRRMQLQLETDSPTKRKKTNAAARRSRLHRL